MVGKFLLSVIMGFNTLNGPLDEFKWQHRLIVIHDVAEPAAQQYHELLNWKKELLDRDIKVLMISPGYVYIDGIRADNISYDELKVELKLEDKFQVFLIGKDGGIKMRSDELVQSFKVFRKIDQMPMRKAEIGIKKTGG